MTTNTKIEGNANIVIQGVTDSTITLTVNGEMQEIRKELGALRALLEGLQMDRIQTAEKIYNIGTITHANFDFLVQQADYDKKLPPDIRETAISGDNGWTQSLRDELRMHGVSVGNKPEKIFQYYGWLIEVFLQKMISAPGKKQTLYSLSFMAEAWQSSLRYLCNIQMVQILQMGDKAQNPIFTDFIELGEDQFKHFDFLNFLLVTTEILPEGNAFLPEINALVSKITNTQNDLYPTVLFLDQYRNQLLKGSIPEDGALENLLDEYLSALVYWLREISFLAKYRMVSIKDINLNYRMGTPKYFMHSYGELHGVFQKDYYHGEEFDYAIRDVEDVFTYNQSVLLFKGSNMDICLNNISDKSTWISLSPLIIDQSVLVDIPKQTPEIYYFTGSQSGHYHFGLYRNELDYKGRKKMASNRTLTIKRQNNRAAGFNALYRQLEQFFKPFKTEQR